MSYISQTNFLTVKEVSEFLQLSVLTIYKYIRERKLEAIEFGGHYRIDKLSLDKFINSHRTCGIHNVPSVLDGEKTYEE